MCGCVFVNNMGYISGYVFLTCQCTCISHGLFTGHGIFSGHCIFCDKYISEASLHFLGVMEILVVVVFFIGHGIFSCHVIFSVLCTFSKHSITLNHLNSTGDTHHNSSI